MSTNLFLTDPRLTFPGATKVAVRPPTPGFLSGVASGVKSTIPSIKVPYVSPNEAGHAAGAWAGYRAQNAAKNVYSYAKQHVVNRASELQARASDLKGDVRNAVEGVKKRIPIVGENAVDNRAARNLATQNAGIHPFLANMSGAHGGMLGAGVGAAIGALAPGRDEDGDERSSVSGALSGAVRGGMAGGALGMVARHGYVNPKIKDFKPDALAAVKAQREAGKLPPPGPVNATVPPGPVAATTPPAAETAPPPAPTEPAPRSLKDSLDPSKYTHLPGTTDNWLPEALARQHAYRAKHGAFLGLPLPFLKVSAPMQGPRSTHPPMPKPTNVAPNINTINGLPKLASL